MNYDNIDYDKAMDLARKAYGYIAAWGAFLITNKFLSTINSNNVSKYAWSFKRMAIRFGKVSLSFALSKLAKETMEDIFDKSMLYADAIIEAYEKRMADEKYKMEKENSNNAGMMA